MSEIKPVIDVCIATYKRQHLLKQLLEKLAVQETGGEFLYSAIVVDNDSDKSAQGLVRKLSAELSISIFYYSQPIKNISKTRNTAIDHATGNYIAFIDDDEYPDKYWLYNLFDAISLYDADAVFGPVVPELPEIVPKWIKEGGVFNRPRFPSGTQVRTGITANALVRAHWIREGRYRFDDQYGTTGGEDSDFFRRMHEAGAKLVWTDCAFVFEEIPLARCNLKWFIRRSFRSGQTFARQTITGKKYLEKIRWVVARCFVSVWLITISVILWLFSKEKSTRYFQRFVSNLGQLSVMSSYTYEEYK
ncbi:MAG: glycosyltransferase family 2 protein [Gammaproteobacteria bacterium]|nr:glycosyltransferase family 2 protein [Gammaproteobacteria bacterium]